MFLNEKKYNTLNAQTGQSETGSLTGQTGISDTNKYGVSLHLNSISLIAVYCLINLTHGDINKYGVSFNTCILLYKFYLQ